MSSDHIFGADDDIVDEQLDRKRHHGFYHHGAHDVYRDNAGDDDRPDVEFNDDDHWVISIDDLFRLNTLADGDEFTAADGTRFWRVGDDLHFERWCV